VGDDGQRELQARGRWRDRVLVVLAVAIGLVLVFHRPILLGLGRRVVLHLAANEHLRADFRLEGSVLTGLVARNFHAVSTGPGTIESIDADVLRADYSLVALLLRGQSQFLKNLEASSARVVLNPAKVVPKPHKKVRLPLLFPDRLKLSDATLVVRAAPHDFAMEHVDLDLNPRNPGELRIARVQWPGGQTSRDVSGQTLYVNRNLIVRDLALNDEERIRLLNLDASRIGAKTLSMNLDALSGVGTISGSMTLSEARSSLSTNAHLLGEKVEAAVLNKYVGLPDGFITGRIERFDLDGTGVLNAPITWRGRLSAQASNVCEQGIVFDYCAFELSAQQGRATLRSADIFQGGNEIHLRGSAELPKDIKQFGRSPGTFEVSASIPDLERFTPKGLGAVALRGSAWINGRIDIKEGRLEANLSASAGPIDFENGRVEKLSANLRASKIIAKENARPRSSTPATAKIPWFAGLRSSATFNVSNLRYRDYVVDSV